MKFCLIWDGSLCLLTCVSKNLCPEAVLWEMDNQMRHMGPCTCSWDWVNTHVQLSNCLWQWLQLIVMVDSKLEASQQNEWLCVEQDIMYISITNGKPRSFMPQVLDHADKEKGQEPFMVFFVAFSFFYDLELQLSKIFLTWFFFQGREGAKTTEKYSVQFNK